MSGLRFALRRRQQGRQMVFEGPVQWYWYLEDVPLDSLEDLAELTLTFVFVHKRSMKRSELFRNKTVKWVTCRCIIQKTVFDKGDHEGGTLFHVQGIFSDAEECIPGFGIGFWGWIYCDDITRTVCSGPVWPL